MSGLNTLTEGLQSMWRPIADTLGQTNTTTQPTAPGASSDQYQTSSQSQTLHMESQEYRRAIEEYRERRIQVNPFKKDDSREFFKLRTHNRLRWSHVFPSGMTS